MSEKTGTVGSDKNPATHVVITLFSEQNFATRVGIAAIIILFLLFAYYLIGGYTNTCGCGSGEHYQNCGCQKMHSHYHQHQLGGYPHVHQLNSSSPAITNPNIYQMSPYL